MANILTRYIDRTIQSLGYMKATDIPKVAQILFAGEAQLNADFRTQTELELQQLSLTNPWVYSNVMLIARRIAMGVLQVEQRDKDEAWKVVEGHDFIKLMEQHPNPFMGQSLIWIYQMIWLLIRGECYWMLVPSKGDELVQIYPIPAGRIEPIPDPVNFISGYRYRATATGKEEILDVKNVCFNRLPNPFQYHRGLSPLTAYSMGLMIDLEAQRFDLEDYKQGLTLRHIVSLRPEISDTDALRYQAELDRGQKENRRFMVTRGGDISMASVTVRRGEGSTDVRRLTQEEANIVYGIPLGLRTSSATEANATVAERTFATDTLWPLMTMLAEELTVQVVKRYYGDDLRASFEDIRPIDQQQKREDENHDREVMTYNEAREQAELPPVKDTDVGNAPVAVAAEIYKAKILATLEPPKEPEIPAPAAEPKPEPEKPDTTVSEEKPEEPAKPDPDDESDATPDALKAMTEVEYWFKEGWL